MSQIYTSEGLIKSKRSFTDDFVYCVIVRLVIIPVRHRGKESNQIAKILKTIFKHEDLQTYQRTNRHIPTDGICYIYNKLLNKFKLN